MYIQYHPHLYTLHPMQKKARERDRKSFSNGCTANHYLKKEEEEEPNKAYQNKKEEGKKDAACASCTTETSV